MRIAGWGGVAVEGRETRSENLERVTDNAVLTRGLGRSYGDSSLPPPSRPVVAGSTLADRLIAFNENTGALRAEAGYTLEDLFRTFLPRGWFTPVTPGTKFVTMGGMVAADVHGKSHHHDGSIGRHVRALKIRVGTGAIVECSRDVEPELFRATIGGMGLTGHILEVELTLERVPTPWIFGHTRRVGGIDEFVERLKESSSEWPFAMGWIDCLTRGPHMGRGVIAVGRWATKEEAPAHFPSAPRPKTVPFNCPEWIMGRAVGRVFNAVVYSAHRYRDRQNRIIHPEKFFYPLDAVLQWNRVYGARGFTQYQCVLPDEAGPGAVRGLMELLTSRNAASFLGVIKYLGDEGDGILSFPRRGMTLALDIPIREGTKQLVDVLNEFVAAKGGRVYLAKDAFMSPEHFRRMEPRLARFEAIRQRWDPERRLKSAQSVRLFGDRP